MDATVPHGWHYYWKTANLSAFDDPLADVLIEHTARSRSPWSYAMLFHLGGAVSAVETDATGCFQRDAVHSLNINAVWLPHEAIGDHETTWARNLHRAVTPHQRGVYLNILDRNDHDQLPAAFDDATYTKLASRSSSCDCRRSQGWSPLPPCLSARALEIRRLDRAPPASRTGGRGGWARRGLGGVQWHAGDDVGCRRRG